ncbi:MAG: DUF2723 domain-containing protein [Ignavibacteriales bacterium]|nr:DUF2723 domain-containing protein [Ignavibacteriales bacterium]
MINLEKFNPKKSMEFKKPKKKGRNEKANVGIAKTEQKEIPEIIKLFTAGFSGLILAFSKTFWFQSTSVEVYSLHLLLICTIIFVLLKAYLQSEEQQNILHNYWFILAIALAFGFSNHMTTLLILPAIAYLFFSKFGFNKASIKKMLYNDCTFSASTCNHLFLSSNTCFAAADIELGKSDRHGKNSQTHFWKTIPGLAVLIHGCC